VAETAVGRAQPRARRRLRQPGRLPLEILVEDRRKLRRLAEAIPGAEITMVRLHAPLALFEERIRRRERDDPEGELCGERWWAAHGAMGGERLPGG
jgi:hypothetical protein